jgi:GNAT superfamily N-acetyltransferase
MSKPVIWLEQLRAGNDDARLLPLLTEYLEWVADQFAALGARIDDRASLVAKHHALFRAELPLLIGQRGRLLVAHSDDQIVGVGALKPVTAEVGEVKRMCVRPGVRGQGIGRAILTQLVAAASAEGYRALRLETAVFMTAARSLYHSVGFREGAPFADSETGKSALAHLTVFMYLNQVPAPAGPRQPDSRSQRPGARPAG